MHVYCFSVGHIKRIVVVHRSWKAIKEIEDNKEEKTRKNMVNKNKERKLERRKEKRIKYWYW